MGKLSVKNKYGVVPNEILNHKSLSFKAKGLYAFIQSKPDDWTFSSERICEQTREGRDSVRAGLRELEDIGLLQRVPIKDEKTHRVIEYDYILHDVIQPTIVTNSEFSDDGKAANGFSANGKAVPISNKEYSKKEIEYNTIPQTPNTGVLETKGEISEQYPLPRMFKIWMQHFPKYTPSMSLDYTALGTICQIFLKKQPNQIPIAELEEFTKKFAKAVQLHNFYKTKPLKTIANNIQEIMPIFNNPKGYLDDLAKPKEQAVLTEQKIVLNDNARMGYPESKGVKIRI